MITLHVGHTLMLHVQKHEGIISGVSIQFVALVADIQEIVVHPTNDKEIKVNLGGRVQVQEYILLFSFTSYRFPTDRFTPKDEERRRTLLFFQI